jgi:hypothetical protein
MDDKLTKELVKQLTRIAEALEKSNAREELSEKRRLTVEKLQEKNLRAELREKINVDPEKIIKTGPRYTKQGL